MAWLHCHLIEHYIIISGINWDDIVSTRERHQTIRQLHTALQEELMATPQQCIVKLLTLTRSVRLWLWVQACRDVVDGHTKYCNDEWLYWTVMHFHTVIFMNCGIQVERCLYMSLQLWVSKSQLVNALPVLWLTMFLSIW